MSAISRPVTYVTKVDFAQLDGYGVPVDGLGNLGDRYYDIGAGRWYLKRWVGNREGSGDGILFPINLFPSVGDFTYEVLVRLEVNTDARLYLASSYPLVSRSVDFMIDNASGFAVNMRDAAGAAQYFKNYSLYGNYGNWNCFKLTRINDYLVLKLNGVDIGTPTLTTAWNPSLTQTGTRALFGAGSNPIMVCNLKITAPGGNIIAPLDEGSGTVITNQAGAIGTLTDGTPTTFWLQTWVPMDLL